MLLSDFNSASKTLLFILTCMEKLPAISSVYIPAYVFVGKVRTLSADGWGTPNSLPSSHAFPLHGNLEIEGRDINWLEKRYVLKGEKGITLHISVGSASTFMNFASLFISFPSSCAVCFAIKCGMEKSLVRSREKIIASLLCSFVGNSQTSLDLTKLILLANMILNSQWKLFTYNWDNFGLCWKTQPDSLSLRDPKLITILCVPRRKCLIWTKVWWW